MSSVYCPLLFSCPEIVCIRSTSVHCPVWITTCLAPAVSLCRGCCRWPRACSRSRTWCTPARAAASSAPPWTASPAPPSAAQSARRSSPGATSSSTTCATTTPSSLSPVWDSYWWRWGNKPQEMEFEHKFWRESSTYLSTYLAFILHDGRRGYFHHNFMKFYI